jgi:hypothetical protein
LGSAFWARPAAKAAAKVPAISRVFKGYSLFMMLSAPKLNTSIQITTLHEVYLMDSV